MTPRQKDIEYLEAIKDGGHLSCFWIQEHSIRRPALIEELGIKLITIGYPMYRVEREGRE